MQTVDEQSGTSFESAKVWDYLQLNLFRYNEMLRSYNDYFVAIAHHGDKAKNLQVLKADISCFYLMNKVYFDMYIIKKKDATYTVDEYLKIVNLNDDKKVFGMMFELVHWSQAEGPFKLLVEKQDPLKWYEK